jgi:hypothetical protein
MAPQDSSLTPTKAPPKLEWCFTPLIPFINRRTDESSFDLLLADRLYPYPAEKGPPTEGLSTAFVYSTPATHLGVVLVQFPNAHLDPFACNLRKLGCAADILAKILASGKPLAQTYVFDEPRI